MSTHRKIYALHLKAAPSVDDGVMAKIRQFTLRDFAPDELQVREYVLAHNCIDRDNECFDEALLDAFATSLPGKGVHIVHPSSWQSDGGPAEGKVFDARTQTMSLDDARKMLGEPNLQLPPDRQQVKLLFANAYFVKTPDNESLLIKQDAGIAGDCSIGFCTDNPPVSIKDTDGRELTARRWLAPGEALEMSLVWLGAQQGARAVKSATTPSKPENTMSLTAEEITALQTKAASGDKAATQLANLKAALGDDAVLLDSPAQLKVHVTDAKAYKSTLIDEIVIAERHLKITADSEEAVRDSKAFLADMPVERLKAMQKGLEARLPTHHQLKGAPTNVAPAGNAAAPEGSPLNNPAISA